MPEELDWIPAPAFAGTGLRWNDSLLVTSFAGKQESVDLVKFLLTYKAKSVNIRVEEFENVTKAATSRVEFAFGVLGA